MGKAALRSGIFKGDLFFWAHSPLLLNCHLSSLLIFVFAFALNWEYTNFDSELGDGRIYCLILSILRLLVSCLRLIFSMIRLPQQHDHLPQPCNVCVNTGIDDMDTHMLSVLLQGFTVLCLPCSALAFAELPRDAASPPCCLGLPQAALPSAHWQKPISSPHTTPCCQPSLVPSRFSGGSTPSSSGWVLDSVFP